MNDRRIPLEKEEARHRKKSKKKGQPRADHKHEYKTVLLSRYYDSALKPGVKYEDKQPVKVCIICGRIGDVDRGQYEIKNLPDIRYRIHEYAIRDEESLEKWYVDDYFDKFAKKMEDYELDKYK